jgi:hypothetical protein
MGPYTGEVAGPHLRRKRCGPPETGGPRSARDHAIVSSDDYGMPHHLLWQLFGSFIAARMEFALCHLTCPST